MVGEFDLIICVEGSDEVLVVCDVFVNYLVCWIVCVGLLLNMCIGFVW